MPSRSLLSLAAAAATATCGSGSIAHHAVDRNRTGRNGLDLDDVDGGRVERHGVRRATHALPLLAALLALLLAACASRPAPDAAIPPSPANRTVLLVSIDALRADWIGSGALPTLDALARGGAHARWMTPSYPTLTFPNHYTLVTGLRPDHHGVVHNVMRDGVLGDFVSKQPSGRDGRWYDGAEPVWVTLERRGVRTATMFWPGSEAEIHGIRPTEWRPFDGAVTPDARVDTVLGWLSMSGPQRPRFVTLYFDEYDHSAHRHGPESPEARAALRGIDAALARMLAGLDARGLRGDVDLVLVSDHGMARIEAGHTLFLDDLLPATEIDVVTTGEVVGVEPRPGHAATVDRALPGRHGHYACWRKAELPARWRYGRNPRVPSYVCQADPGWELTTRAEGRQRTRAGGEHGYEPATPDMRAVFVANGPDFRAGAILQPFDNVDVYPLLMHLLGVAPLPNDGDIAPLLPALRATTSGMRSGDPAPRGPASTRAP